MIHAKYVLMTGLLITTPALAAYAPPEPIKSSDTIVVTGQKLEKKAVKQEATQFIRTVIAKPDDEQYARRNAPICPKVFGIDAQYAQIVEKRIRDVATAVDAQIAQPNCKLNLVVRFSGDGDAYINKLKAAKPGLFSSIPLSERKSFYASIGPVRWWYNLHFTGSDGSNLEPNAAVNIPIGLTLSSKGFSRSQSPSLINTNFIVKIEASTVVIDVNKVTGFPLDTIASYAAMLSLGHIRQDADYIGAPSILGIFNAAKTIADAPRDLTEWDYAYLRALYKIPLNRIASTQRSKIASAMAKQLTSE
jgi:hypothetical protein